MEDVSAKVEALLGKMTLEEKVAQMLQIPYSMISREEALHWAKIGAGSFLHVLGDNAREIQQAALSSRLGIPVIFGIDAIHGHGLNDHATIFPSQLAAACSWNPDMVEEMGRVTAREVATDGLHWTFSPVLCLARDPRWGRTDETFGEDPYLAAQLGAAIVRGYQGDDLSDNEHILACAKHYIGYGEAVGARDSTDTEITERKLREVFLPPFKAAFDAGCATVMTAYGSMDGTPLTTSHKAMKEILRDELGFDGFVVTDWNNIGHLVNDQHVAENVEDASIKAASAGNDMIMTNIEFFDAALKAVREGRLDEGAINAAVRHILTIKFRMGLFEQYEKKGVPGCFGCEEHLASALDAARQSITLLSNNGILPLNNVKKIAVVGPNADDIAAQYGDWTYFSHPDPCPTHTPIRPYVTVKEGFEKICAEQGIEITYAKGCSQLNAPDDDISAAVKAAEGADVAFVVVGDMIDQIGEAKDRANLSLSGRQLELYLAIKRLGIPVVTVLVASKPLCLEQAAEADAVICAFNGGMFGGQAVAEAAFGCYNPSGRLPISFPHHSGQVPIYYNTLPGWHTFKSQSGKYCDLPSTPLYAFGEGMSYTSFAYENLKFDPDTFLASVKVTNTGKVAGIETVQVYFRDVVSSVMTPQKQLIAFDRVSLDAGESKVVTFQLKREDFSLVNAACQRVTEPGEFVLFVGHSSKDEDLQTFAFRLD